MVFPHDQLEEYRSAFQKAERDWLRWRSMPANHAGYGSRTVGFGPMLLDRLERAMRAYEEYARAQTNEKLQNAGRNGISVKTSLDLGQEIDWGPDYLPDFLRRRTD